MKFGRVLLLGTGVLAVLLLLAVGAAFHPALQTWVARRALAGRPGLEVSIGRVSAGLQRIQVQDVRVVRGGARLTLPAAELDVPVVALAFRDQLLIRRLVAHGWTLDLTSAPALTARPPARSQEVSLLTTAWADEALGAVALVPPAVFAGIFQHLRLPVDLALDGVDLAGEVLLPVVPGRPAVRAKVTLTGGRLAAGQPGGFDYTATVTFAGPNLAVQVLTIRGTLGVVMDTPRTLSRLVVATVAEAQGPKFPAGVKLAVDLAAARTGLGENYAVTLTTGAKQLAALETSYPAGANHLGGNWRLDMRDSDLAPFSLGRELPAFEAVGEGRFDTDTAFSELHASGRLKGSVDRLQVVNDQLSGLGTIQLDAEFDVAQRAGATRVDRLAVTVAGARPVATIQALQAFEFNLKGDLNVADPVKDLLGIVIQGLPLAWVNPLLAKAGYRATGSDLQGEFAAGARQGGFALRAKGPLTVGQLAVSRVGGPAVLTPLDLSLDLAADYTPQGWQVVLAPLVARRNGNTLLTVEGKVGRLAGPQQSIKVAGKWSGQLPALLAQPALLGATVLTTGEGQGDFAASLAERQSVQLRLSLRNLASAAAAHLPAVTAELRLDREPDGKITFNAPLRLEHEQRQSDLTLAGTATAVPGQLVLDARLTSDFLAVEDAQLLAGALGGAATPAPAEGGAGAPAVAAPYWAGLSGQVALAFKKIVASGQFQVTEVTGVLRLDAGSAKLVDVRGGFDADSAVRMAGEVSFRPAATEPYTLNAELALTNFATAPAFRAIEPTKPPAVEARINVLSRFAATGRTLPDLADRARGDVLITSKGGILRLLAADLTDRIQRTQSRVTAIAGFLGVVPDDYVNKAKILSEIARSFAEIPFDQLSVTASRDAALNLQLKDFSLISPEVRLSGTGEIRQVAGVPVLAQPLDLQLNLGARGKLGDLIRRAGLLETRQDSLGYAAFAVPLRIGGTLGNPDTNAIRTALLNSALERSGLLDGLLGK